MPSPADTSARLPLRTAMEAGDLDAAVAAFAPDAVVRSPLTDRLAFNGGAQIRAILAVILDLFEELRYVDEMCAPEHAVLVGRARVAGKELQFIDHMRLDGDGRIREFTVFFRPLPATAAAARAIGAALARRKSRTRSLLISTLARPLGAMTAAGDPVGARLVRRTL